MPSPFDFSVKPVLEGETVRLRPFRAADGPSMLKILAEAELRRLTGSVETAAEASRPHSPEAAEAILKWYQSRSQQDDRLDLAIIDKAADALVGEVVFNEVDETARTANFRILIGQAGQNRGIGSAAIALLLRYGFLSLELSKVTLEVFAFNPRAISVYQKSGFALEEILPEDFSFDGQLTDTLVLGLTRVEYISHQETD